MHHHHASNALMTEIVHSVPAQEAMREPSTACSRPSLLLSESKDAQRALVLAHPVLLIARVCEQMSACVPRDGIGRGGGGNGMRLLAGVHIANVDERVLGPRRHVGRIMAEGDCAHGPLQLGKSPNACELLKVPQADEGVGGSHGEARARRVKLDAVTVRCVRGHAADGGRAARG